MVHKTIHYTRAKEFLDRFKTLDDILDFHKKELVLVKKYNKDISDRNKAENEKIKEIFDRNKAENEKIKKTYKKFG